MPAKEVAGNRNSGLNLHVTERICAQISVKLQGNLSIISIMFFTEKCFSHLYLTNNSSPPVCIVKGNTPPVSDGATSHFQLSDSKINWSELCCLNWLMIVLLFCPLSFGIRVL